MCSDYLEVMGDVCSQNSVSQQNYKYHFECSVLQKNYKFCVTKKYTSFVCSDKF
jgi:hypothetical protein